MRSAVEILIGLIITAGLVFIIPPLVDYSQTWWKLLFAVN